MSPRKPLALNPALPWFVAGVVVTLLALLFGYQAYVESLHQDKQPMTLQETIVWQLEWWYLWLALAPLILLLSKRFHVSRPGNPRNLLVHIPAAGLFALAHTSIHTFLNWCADAVAGKLTPFWDAVMRNGLAEHFQLGIIFYAVMVTIASALNYYRIFRREELKAFHMEAQLSQTRFQAMKMQVYPHFLFNTLREITRLMKENVDRADTMIARLGDFLRLSMENIGTQEVALQREITFLKSYLEIERIRTENRLSFDVDVDPDAMNAQVPNLLLQPLIESAVTNTGNLPAHLRISARRENGHLRVQITDNCKKGDNSGQYSSSLMEMRDRLQTLYGDAFYLDSVKSPDGKNALTLEIPVD